MVKSPVFNPIHRFHPKTQSSLQSTMSEFHPPTISIGQRITKFSLGIFPLAVYMSQYHFNSIENLMELNMTYPTDPFSYNWYDWTSAGIYLICAAAFSWVLLRYYTRKRPLDWGSYIALLVTFVPLFYMILLLTVDIAAGLDLCMQKTGGREDISCMYMIPFFFVVIYSILYWSVFFLSWIIVPYYQSWVENGDFFFFRKVLGTLVDNVCIFIFLIPSWYRI